MKMFDFSTEWVNFVFDLRLNQWNSCNDSVLSDWPHHAATLTFLRERAWGDRAAALTCALSLVQG